VKLPEMKKKRRERLCCATNRAVCAPTPTNSALRKRRH
jgi:hypothetical protein